MCPLTGSDQEYSKMIIISILKNLYLLTAWGAIGNLAHAKLLELQNSLDRKNEPQLQKHWTVPAVNVQLKILYIFQALRSLHFYSNSRSYFSAFFLSHSFNCFPVGFSVLAGQLLTSHCSRPGPSLLPRGGQADRGVLIF